MCRVPGRYECGMVSLLTPSTTGQTCAEGPSVSGATGGGYGLLTELLPGQISGTNSIS